MKRGRKLYALVLTGAAFLIATTVSADNWFTKSFGKGIEGSGDRVTVERHITESFNKIRTYGAFDLYVTVGEEQSLKITFDDNLIELIETDVHGKTLRIDTDKSYHSKHGGHIDITVPELTSISSYGSGDIVVENLNSDFFEFDLKGSGDMTAKGNVDELDISLAGSGDIDTRDLLAREAIVVIKGSGDIKVHAKEDFDGAIYGSGDIDCYGDPKHVSRHVAGTGDITMK